MENKKYIIEFIGTFFLVLTVALSRNPLAIGAVLIALVYMGGYISGAHYNPAVTLAVWLSKKMPAKTALGYALVQMAGGIVAALTFSIIRGAVFIPKPSPTVPLWHAILAEALFTFLLASVVLHVAATDKTKGNDYYGLAIGLTVMAGGFAVGPLSGGAFNPAIGVGPVLFDFAHISSHTTNLLVYLIGPFLGAAIASIIYRAR